MSNEKNPTLSSSLPFQLDTLSSPTVTNASDLTTAPTYELELSSPYSSFSTPASSSSSSSSSPSQHYISKRDLLALIDSNPALSEKISHFSTLDHSKLDVPLDFDLTTQPISEPFPFETHYSSHRTPSTSPALKIDGVDASPSSSSSSQNTKHEIQNFSPSHPPLLNEDPKPTVYVNIDSNPSMETLADLLQNIDLPSQQSLFWVPAHRHPEIAPIAFKEWLSKQSMKLNSVAAKLNRRKSYKESTQILSFELDPSSGEDKVVVSPVQDPNISKLLIIFFLILRHNICSFFLKFFEEPSIENPTENLTSFPSSPPMSPTSFQPHEPPRFTVERPLKRSMKKVSRPKKDASNRVHSYLADTTTLDISLPPPPKSPSSFSEMPFTSLSKPEEENEANEIFHNALSSSIDFQKFDLNDTLQSTHDLNPTEVMDPLSQSTPLFSKNQSSEASLSSLISGNLPTIHNDATLAKIGKNFHLAAYSAPELSTPSKPISPPLEKKEIEPLKKAKRKLSFFRMLDKKKSPLIHQAPQPTSTSTPVTSTSVLPSPSSPVLSTDTTLLTKDEQSTELTTIGPLKDKFTAPRLFSWLFHHTHFLHLPSSSSSSSSSTSSFSSSSTSSSSSTTSTSSTTTSSSSSSSTSFFKSSVMSTSKSKPIEPPLMLPTRYPLHLERALCRMSHQKLANPRRPLYHQVLISNLLVYWLALNPMALDPMVIPRKQKSKQKKKKSTLKKRSSSLVPNHAKQPYRNVPRVDMHQKESPSMSSRLLGASFVQTPPPPPSDNLENPHFSNGKREKKESMEDFRDNEGDIDLNEDEFENANGMEENDDDIEDEQEEQEEQEDDDLPLGLVMKNKKNKNSFES